MASNVWFATLALMEKWVANCHILFEMIFGQLAVLNSLKITVSRT